MKEYSGKQYSGSFIVCIKRLIESILVLISQLDSPLNCIVFPLEIHTTLAALIRGFDLHFIYIYFGGG